MSTINERMQQIVDTRFNGNKANFARAIGIAPTSITNYIGKKRASVPSAEIVERIVNLLDVDAKWLVTGKSSEGSETQTRVNANSGNGVPFFRDLPVSGGFMEQYPDRLDMMPTGLIDMPMMKGAEFCFPVIGCSMAPTINEGDYIGVRHVDNFETTAAERLYMIVTRDNERMIKRIVEYSEEGGYILLKSDNPEYPIKKLPTSQILEVYKVVFKLEVETM